MTNQDIINSWSQYPEEEVVAFGDDGDFSRQYLLNPHLFNLLGNARDKHILDAGSGTGYLSRKLAHLGAIVTALEPSDNLYNYAVRREKRDPLGITYLQQDLSTASLPANFDIVIANMVLMDIPEYQAAMQNCINAIKSGGQFIFSLSHPCFDEQNSRDFLNQGYLKLTNYFNQTTYPVRFGRTFHRPLSNYLNFCLDHHLALQRFIEPQLAIQDAATFPQARRDTIIPSFIIMGWRKNGQETRL